MMAPMAARPPTFRFADTCRTLAAAARAAGLEAPSFRSPPGVAGAVRTVRFRAEGPAVVSVAHRDRPSLAVAADLIEGVVVVNRLDSGQAIRARSALWEAVSAMVATDEAA
jgi:hypothetical protein